MAICSRLKDRSALACAQANSLIIIVHAFLAALLASHRYWYLVNVKIKIAIKLGTMGMFVLSLTVNVVFILTEY